jgi:ATP-dependent Clp protease ATP-binding subunit ClpA
LDIHSVDMASMRNETDIFGAKMPFKGYEIGSPLNNFLVMHSGESAIVFLDEFEKAAPGVHNALLIPFGEGWSS